MRGVIGYGTNMMNIYTVMRATQGLCKWVQSLGKAEMERGVVISYDTRRKSETFAKAAAAVLAKNGVSDLPPAFIFIRSSRNIQKPDAIRIISTSFSSAVLPHPTERISFSATAKIRRSPR